MSAPDGHSTVVVVVAVASLTAALGFAVGLTASSPNEERAYEIDPIPIMKALRSCGIHNGTTSITATFRGNTQTRITAQCREQDTTVIIKSIDAVQAKAGA